MPSGARSVFVALVLLVMLSGMVLLVEARARARRPDHAEEFQHLVGGIGFGPALDLDGCAFGFDPRLDCSCSSERGPIPGGSCFCPRHAGSLFFYRPLDRGKPLWEEGDRDAPLP